MAKFKTVTLVAPGELAIVEQEQPRLEPDQMLLRVDMAGICATDLEVLDLRKPFPCMDLAYPFACGHEFVGTIVEMGPRAPRQSLNGQPLAVGDRIMTSWPMTNYCGRCYYCRILFQPQLCVGSPEVPTSQAVGGGWAEYYQMPPGLPVLKLPNGMSFEVGVLTEPMAVSIHALDRAHEPGVPARFEGFGAGATAVIQGAGTIGLLITAMAKIGGATNIIVVGSRARRLDMARRFGADHIIDIQEMQSPEERARRVRELSPFGEGADVVFEAAGKPAAFTEGLDMVRRGGTYVICGAVAGERTINLNPAVLAYKEIRLLGSWGNPPSSYARAIEVLHAYRKTMPFDQMITHRYPLSQLEEALAMARNHDESVKVVLTPHAGARR